MNGSEEPLGWQTLVTDGHVRAARIRRVQPWLISAAVISILVGWQLLGSIAPSKAENDRDRVLYAAVESQRRLAQYAFSRMPAPSVGRSRVAASPASSEVATFEAQILESLDRTGELPEQLPNGPRIRSVESPAFWRTPWSAGELVASSATRVRIVGGIVNSGSPDFPVAERWLAVFRRGATRWEAVWIAAPGFVGAPETPGVGIRDIPVTLSQLLETEE